VADLSIICGGFAGIMSSAFGALRVVGLGNKTQLHGKDNLNFYYWGYQMIQAILANH